MQAYFNRTSPFIFKTLGEIRSNHLTPKNKLAQKELVQKSTKLKMTKCSFQPVELFLQVCEMANDIRPYFSQYHFSCVFIYCLKDGRQRFWRFNIGLHECLEDLWDDVYSKYKGWIILDIFSSLIYNIGVISFEFFDRVFLTFSSSVMAVSAPLACSYCQCL